MRSILDQANFQWIPSHNTDVMATFKKHGFKKTTVKERAKRFEEVSWPARNVRWHLPPHKRG